jgi:hypothetical protein
MDMIWIFFFQDICSLANISKGNDKIATSSMISMAPRMNPKSRTSTVHRPLVSPRHPFQKNDIGWHWNIIAPVLPMPKQVTIPIRMYVVVVSFGEVAIRR